MTKNQQPIIVPQQHQSVTIRLAKENDVAGAKLIAAKCSKELGFVNIATLRKAQEKGWLLVAAGWNFQMHNDEIIGFVKFRIKKDHNCTLYDIAVQGDLQPQDIEEKLPEIIGSLLSIKAEGAEIVETNNKIQTQLQCERSDLSAEAQYLLNLIGKTTTSDFTQLIIQLRKSESEKFPDTSQIIKSLEELYQHNWININISLSLKQQ